MLVRFVALLCLLNCVACGCISKNTVPSRKVEHSQLSFKTVSSMSEVPNLVDKFLSENPGENGCWVVLDVDYTLTMPAMIHESKKCAISKESLSKVVVGIKDSKQFDRVISSTLFFPQVLIDEQTPEILYGLRKRGVNVFALTAAVGSEKHKQIRFETLRTIGINFSGAFSFTEASLDDIKPYSGQCPSFSNGVLYANGERDPNNNKGRVLASFMKKIKQSPSCIVVVDDRKRNLEDIEKSLENTNIKFLGVLYNDIKKYDDVPVDVLKKHISDVLTKENL